MAQTGSAIPIKLFWAIKHRIGAYSTKSVTEYSPRQKGKGRHQENHNHKMCVHVHHLMDGLSLNLICIVHVACVVSKTLSGQSSKIAIMTWRDVWRRAPGSRIGYKCSGGIELAETRVPGVSPHWIPPWRPNIGYPTSATLHRRSHMDDPTSPTHIGHRTSPTYIGEPTSPTHIGHRTSATPHGRPYICDPTSATPHHMSEAHLKVITHSHRYRE